MRYKVTFEIDASSPLISIMFISNLIGRIHHRYFIEVNSFKADNHNQAPSQEYKETLMQGLVDNADKVYPDKSVTVTIEEIK